MYRFSIDLHFNELNIRDQAFISFYLGIAVEFILPLSKKNKAMVC